MTDRDGSRTCHIYYGKENQRSMALCEIPERFRAPWEARDPDVVVDVRGKLCPQCVAKAHAYNTSKEQS